MRRWLSFLFALLAASAVAKPPDQKLFPQNIDAANRTASSETVNGTARTYNWAYDYLYRLTGETIGNMGTVNYGFDAVGNRTNRTSSVSGIANQASTFTANDWLGSDGYDSNGNTTNSASIAYRYDALNHLTNANNGAVLIAYDGDGNRMSKKVGSTTTYYLLDDRNPSGYVQVLEEWTSTGTPALSRVYNYGLDLISQRAPGVSTNYFIYDGHGSTRALANAGGNVVNAFAYDAYGMLIASNSAPQTAYLYSGEQFDSDLNFYYLRARYLNPNTGRFWSMDSYNGSSEDPLSLHKYLYCDANPANMVDPSGHDGDLCSISFTMGIMAQQASLEMKGAQAILTSARAMFGADDYVNNIIYGLDIANIINDKVGQVALGVGAVAGGFKMLSFCQEFLSGSAAKLLTEKVMLTLEKMGPALKEAPEAINKSYSWEARQNSFPDAPGIYIIRSKSGQVYVGKASNLKARLSERDPVFLNHEHINIISDKDSEVFTMELDAAKLNGASQEDALSAAEEFYVRALNSKEPNGLNVATPMNDNRYQTYIIANGFPPMGDPMAH